MSAWVSTAIIAFTGILWLLRPDRFEGTAWFVWPICVICSIVVLLAIIKSIKARRYLREIRELIKHPFAQLSTLTESDFGTRVDVLCVKVRSLWKGHEDKYTLANEIYEARHNPGLKWVDVLGWLQDCLCNNHLHRPIRRDIESSNNPISYNRR